MGTVWRPRALAATALVGACLAALRCGGSDSTSPLPAPSPTVPAPPENPPPGTTNPPVPGVTPQTFVGAGDIGWCGSAGPEQTARLIESMGGTVFALGDNAYFSGTKKEFDDCYHPSWGRFRSRTRPVPGNHEYAGGLGPYLDYFRAGNSLPGGGVNPYYSFPLGDNWHAVALDSWLSVAEGSPQAVWLRGDLAANRKRCTVAYFHYPLFTSGPNGNQTQMRPLWRILYEFDVDIVINGHDHLYEKFAPQNPDGVPDSVRGIREFIVGTGGAMPYSFVTTMPNSERRITNTFGVLKLTLAEGYHYDFVPVGGGPNDSGDGLCH